ncbi:MAG: hypothetical protein IJS17_06205 [Clostridia bacterium]|nr:hypothetical protein [Clostridia bacterium]
MNEKFYYRDLVEKIEKITQKYPFVSNCKIGQSVCGRDIYALSVGNYKNTVLFVGGFGARDSVTVRVLLEYVERLCRAFKNRSRLSGVNVSSPLLTRGLSVVACLNPDGMEIASSGAEAAGEYADFVRGVSDGDTSLWNANAKGVDISKNFNSQREKIPLYEANKGIFGPAASGYGGFAAESEPETSALVNFCEKNNIHHAIALLGNGKAINWRSENTDPENSRTMAKVLSVCCGYGILNTRCADDLGSFKDWFCENYKRSALSLGVKETDDFDKTYKTLEEMLVIGTII